MNKSGLRTKLLLSHLGVALCSLLIIMFLVNLVMSFSFGRYVEARQRAEAGFLLADLEQAYDSSNSWSMDTLMSLSHQAMLRDYSIRLYDVAGKLIWDTGNMGMSAVASDDAASRYSVMGNGANVGTLEIQGNGGAEQMQNRDFLQMFNRLSWGALLLVLGGAYLYSRYMAKDLSRPLVRIKGIAVRMREGDLTERVTLPASRQTEIDEVGQALNYLADTLQQQEKLRKNLTADVAHELRTPLTTVQSYIEAFQDGVWEATPERLQICHGQILRLVQLIDDLEKLNAAENPMLQLRYERLCLNDVLRDSVHSVAGRPELDQVVLTLKEETEHWVSGDYERLVQVFVNLLNNALKFTKEGQVEITFLENPSEVIVSIADTGAGIAEDELPYIFERFYRGEKSRSRKTGGAGIGLAIVKAIVEAHGGQITVSSTLGSGTEFNVHLPR
ncbi:cell wall metabolism sensor histidine kinase WalK [Paenibacillus sp. P32E]|uniref:sensor histidine kinase n=1 Tax=Paenibacillus sp. P32E TaxID=1349434 RepID=UPI00093AE6C1|nr:HAMP domain-containing sensor histidine kinase [Paenibacillus sp. P32E]OKP92990.1 two-component sensor histidine kinase [Paenibacillus sp. P32E]